MLHEVIEHGEDDEQSIVADRDRGVPADDEALGLVIAIPKGGWIDPVAEARVHAVRRTRQLDNVPQCCR